MNVLGAVLAGGTSRRFGSDKALAPVNGRPLLAHVVASLAAECAVVVVCGRRWGDHQALPDQPRAGLGPLGGLLAALEHAANADCKAVLLAPCDMPDLPAGLVQRLAPGPAVADRQWLLGLWPAPLAPALRSLLVREGAISMRRWMEFTSARVVDVGPLRNINRPEDLRQPG